MTYRINDNGVDRDMTPDEIAAYETAQQSINAENDARAAAVEAAIAAKESAKAKLASLGLTEAEVNAIIGVI